jgi:hypothetical protein
VQPVALPRNARPVATPAGAVEDFEAVTYYVPELNNSVHPDPRNDPHLVKCYQEFVEAWKEVKSVNCGGKNRKHKSPHSQVSKIVLLDLPFLMDLTFVSALYLCMRPSCL